MKSMIQVIWFSKLSLNSEPVVQLCRDVVRNSASSSESM